LPLPFSFNYGKMLGHVSEVERVESHFWLIMYVNV